MLNWRGDSCNPKAALFVKKIRHGIFFVIVGKDSLLCDFPVVCVGLCVVQMQMDSEHGEDQVLVNIHLNYKALHVVLTP